MQWPKVHTRFTMKINKFYAHKILDTKLFSFSGTGIGLKTNQMVWMWKETLKKKTRGDIKMNLDSDSSKTLANFTFYHIKLLNYVFECFLTKAAWVDVPNFIICVSSVFVFVSLISTIFESIIRICFCWWFSILNRLLLSMLLQFLC